MMGRFLFISICASLLTSCFSKDSDTTSTVNPSCNTVVRYEWDEDHQETRKYTEYFNEVTKSCSQKRLPLTTFEQGLDYRRRNHIQCTPQTIPSVYLKTDGNFYSYRDGRIYLELNAATGQFRRISIGVTSDSHTAGAGKPSFSRDIGCFFVRTDIETEPVNPNDYGSQLLLDLGASKASTEEMKPSEIFRYATTGTTWAMTRFDQNYDIDWSFCPDSIAPWEFCTALRNGNPYFQPQLDPATEADLHQQALLIRSEYNFTEITQDQFDAIWGEAEKSYIETPLQSFKYQPLTFVDVPDFVWDAWAEYVRGNRPAMPDVYSVNFPAFCYPARKSVTYSDGSTGTIIGTACYDGSGQYTFQ